MSDITNKKVSAEEEFGDRLAAEALRNLQDAAAGRAPAAAVATDPSRSRLCCGTGEE